MNLPYRTQGYFGQEKYPETLAALDAAVAETPGSPRHYLIAFRRLGNLGENQSAWNVSGNDARSFRDQWPVNSPAGQCFLRWIRAMYQGGRGQDGFLKDGNCVRSTMRIAFGNATASEGEQY